MNLAWRIARRELRGGLRGFWVFLACLTLGVAAIAAIGTVRGAIEAGLTEQGAVILGGDVEIQLTYRFAEPEEPSNWIVQRHEAPMRNAIAMLQVGWRRHQGDPNVAQALAPARYAGDVAQEPLDR